MGWLDWLLVVTRCGFAGECACTSSGSLNSPYALPELYANGDGAWDHMAAFGQAILEYSRTSALESVPSFITTRSLRVLTQRGMLKGQGNDILDSFKWGRAVWAGESFSNHDPDPAVKITRIPVSLIQNVLMETGETKAILVAVPIDI